MKRSIDTHLSSLAEAYGVEREERWLAGVLAGALYLLGGGTLALFAALPGLGHRDPVALLGLAGIALAWGLLSALVIDWERRPAWFLLPANAGGLVAVAIATAASGGTRSPGWIYLFFLAAFAGYFYRGRVAYAYLLGCVLAHASVLAYDRHGVSEQFLPQFLIAAPAYVILGMTILAGKRRMWELRGRAQRLAAEQGALRRVATAVVSGEPAERIYERVSYEAARLLDGTSGGVLRLDDERAATVTGAWAQRPEGAYPAGETVPITPGGGLEFVQQTGRPMRVATHPDHSPAVTLGYRSSVLAPIRVGGRIWGALCVVSDRRSRFTADDERHLVDFADLLATAIRSLEDRAKLAAQASTDPLTGLANHRTLQKRLAAEVARATRHRTPLSVAVIDIDHFKQINDTSGHETGDRVLMAVARCLQEAARTEDTLGRVGGDEFAWILPETSREQARVAVERARRMVAAALRPYAITVSAGICDTTVCEDPSDLINLADGSLYWSKAHGRNRCWVYDPAQDSELSAQERAERLHRSQALAGLRSLGRAVDDKDPATRRHSERVAELAGKLALAVGWAPDRARLLSEAALVHDVGKIGVPDALLIKPAGLTAEERRQIRAHAELAARIVADVLAPEQVEWIRTHHERPDGTGYPVGLRGHEIPEGGALLAVADAWDVMTKSRPFGIVKTPDEALVELIELVGRQFSDTAVSAIVELHSTGELPVEDLLVA